MSLRHALICAALSAAFLGLQPGPGLAKPPDLPVDPSVACPEGQETPQAMPREAIRQAVPLPGSHGFEPPGCFLPTPPDLPKEAFRQAFPLPGSHGFEPLDWLKMWGTKQSEDQGIVPASCRLPREDAVCNTLWIVEAPRTNVAGCQNEPPACDRYRDANFFRLSSFEVEQEPTQVEPPLFEEPRNQEFPLYLEMLRSTEQLELAPVKPDDLEAGGAVPKVGETILHVDSPPRNLTIQEEGQDR